MESNNNDNYVLVLEDRTEVKNEQEAGKLSVVSGIDDKGNITTIEATAANQAAFLKFNSKEGLLENFMKNILRLFNEPTRFGLYKVVADNVEQGVNNLRTLLQNREMPESKQQLAEMGVPFEDYLPRQKSDLITIAIPMGDTTIYTDARLAFRTDGTNAFTWKACRQISLHWKV